MTADCRAATVLTQSVERSHLTNKLEFYQLIDYKGDVDLARKLRDWEAFYNFLRPRAALNGKTPMNGCARSW
jgi:transposase InsO family protein